MKAYQLKEHLEIPSLVLAATTHIGCIIGGVYKGIMESTGNFVNPSYLLPLMGANVATNGIVAAALHEDEELVGGIKGMGVGAFASPFEVILGYGIGYLGGKVFY